MRRQTANRVSLVALLSVVATGALGANWVSNRDNTGLRVGVNMDTFEAYRTKDGIRVWRAYIAFGDDTPIAAAVEPPHCQRAYGDLVYGSSGNANVYHFELSGETNGDFIARTLCEAGERSRK